jgi:hypothetical protein
VQIQHALSLQPLQRLAAALRTAVAVPMRHQPAHETQQPLPLLHCLLPALHFFSSLLLRAERRLAAPDGHRCLRSATVRPKSKSREDAKVAAMQRECGLRRRCSHKRCIHGGPADTQLVSYANQHQPHVLPSSHSKTGAQNAARHAMSQPLTKPKTKHVNGCDIATLLDI